MNYLHNKEIPLRVQMFITNTYYLICKLQINIQLTLIPMFIIITMTLTESIINTEKPG